MSCDVGEVTERLENELCFTYVTAHSPTLQLLHLRHGSFSNPSFASPTPQTLHLIHLASRPWWTCIVLLKKHITFLSKKWKYHGVYNLCIVAGTVYFILQKHQMNWFIMRGLQSILANLWEIKKNCLESILLPVQTLTFQLQYHDEGNLGPVTFLDKTICWTFKIGNSMFTQFRKKMWLMPQLYEAIRMWPRVWTDYPHTMKPEVGPVYRGRMHSGRLCSTPRHTRVQLSKSIPRNCKQNETVQMPYPPPTSAWSVTPLTSLSNKQYLEGSIEGVDWLTNYQMSLVTFNILIFEIIGAIPSLNG